MPEGATFTYADLIADFPVDNVQRELFDGELVVSPSPKVRHQQLVGRLFLILGQHVAIHGGGEVFGSPLDVVLSETNVLQPDLLFIADDQLHVLTEDNVRGAPALVVEVVSDSRRDRVRKKELYARFGVRESWIVDPDADRVEVYRLVGPAYGKPQILEPGEVLAYDGLPGLAIDLTALFAR
jgi:Uma2 family endonuclease